MHQIIDSDLTKTIAHVMVLLFLGALTITLVPLQACAQKTACPDASLIESAPYVPHVVLLQITHKHSARLYDIVVKEVLRGPMIPHPVPHRLFIGEKTNVKDLSVGSTWVMQVLKRTYDSELFLPECYHTSQVSNGMVEIGKDKRLPNSIPLEQLREELKRSNQIQGWW